MPSRFKGAPHLSSLEEIQRLHIYSPIDIFRISISLEKRWLNLNTSTFISTWSVVVVIVSGGSWFGVYLGIVYKHSLVSDWVLIFKLIFQGSDSAQSLEFHQHTRRSCLKYLLAHLRGRRRRHTLPSTSYTPKVCFNGFSLNRIECAQQSKLYSLVINIISL